MVFEVIKRKLFVLMFFIMVLVVSLFVYENQKKIPCLPLSFKSIKEIKLEGTNDRLATEKEIREIVTLLNDKKKYDEMINDHSWPPPQSQIEILLKNGNVIQIRQCGYERVLIGYRYIVRQPEICKLLEKLLK
jgi:hypothetical protein